jgi:Uncharacterized conserved protein (DUF2190)
MAHLQPLSPGFRYGLGLISGVGEMGQVVKLEGDDLFSVNTSPSTTSFGVLAGTYKDGEMCGVYCQGGIYDTDQHSGTIAAGDDLACDSTGKLRKAATEEKVVALAMSFQSGTLRFKLLV